MWPKNPSRVPGRAHTCLSASVDVADRRDRGRHPRSGRAVAHHREGQHPHQRTGGADAGECGRPPDCGEAGRRTERRTESDPSWPTIVVSWVMTGTRRGDEPSWDERQRRREDDRVAGADQNSRRSRNGHGCRVRQQDLPARPAAPRWRRASLADRNGRRADPAGICATENTATWMNTNAARAAGAEPESIRGVQACSGEGGALHDRQDVGGHAHGPDQPGHAGPCRHCGRDRRHGDTRSLGFVATLAKYCHICRSMATGGT